MLKRILIPLEEYDYSKVAIDYGVHLAESGKCRLSGLSIVDIPSIEKSLGPVPVGGTYYALQEEKLRTTEEEKLAKKLMQEFVAVCRTKNIANRIIMKEGTPEDIIINESKYHDLVIIGYETSFHYGKEIDKKLQHQLISHGISPVLLIPEAYREIKKVLLCYDGSLQATKTIHQFVQFEVWKQRQVILLNVNNDVDAGAQLLENMAEYLTAWDISFEKVCLEGHPKTVILNYIHENDIDLVVIGAYGRKSILSFFFGSTANGLIEKAERPIFIYH